MNRTITKYLYKRIIVTRVCCIFLSILLLSFMACKIDPGSFNDGLLLNRSLSSTQSAFESIPVGANIVSAQFSIYAFDKFGFDITHTVNVYRITAPWEEATVTWNSFNGGYNNQIVNTYYAEQPGWYTVDITELVQEWINESSDNFGILLKQVEELFTVYYSGDFETISLRPMVEICFAAGMGEQSIIIRRGSLGDIADAYIWERPEHADVPHPYNIHLFTGLVEGYEKQTLIKFDIPINYDEEYTRTIGYWNTHTGFGPQADVVTPLLPIYLGNAGGPESILVDTNQIAYDILLRKEYGHSSNGITKLYAQLLGAKLNIANGADLSLVNETINAADSFLADISWGGWDGLSKADKKQVLRWMTILDNYNNGLLIP